MKREHNMDAYRCINEQVSIVVPVYNVAEYIAETIHMVEQQTYTNWELILVEDCSTDNSYERIKERIRKSAHADKIHLIRQSRNGGAARARNTGVNAARGRYIAYLDADDVWLASKLEEQLLFMKQKSAAFSFTSYEYGDERARPTGRIVHVPGKLNFKKALSQTVIFTSTVMFDTWHMDKNLIRMPEIGSEDTATWWKILKTGITAYGMDRVLTVYRRSANSLSANKVVAVQRLWNLLRRVAGFGTLLSAWYLMRWAFHATTRRVWFKKVNGRSDSKNRIMILSSGAAELFAMTAVYAYVWFHMYYPILQQQRISVDGYDFGKGLKLYSKGHLLVLVIYFVLMFFFLKMYRGTGLGESKPGSTFFSQVFAILTVDAITYFQLSLMRNWLVSPRPMMMIVVWQVMISLVISFLFYSIYRSVFPARELLLISNEDNVEPILGRFSMRADMYYIVKTVNLQQKMDKVKELCREYASGVVIWNVADQKRYELLRYCYEHNIRVYLMPQMEDVLLGGIEKLHQFDTSIYLLSNYPEQIEERVLKRLLDIVVSLLLIILTSPVMLMMCIYVRCCDQADAVLFRQKRCTRNERVFELLKFRTMKKIRKADGLHYEIMPFGSFVRRMRLDELPQLFNILKGEMSFIGPRPDTVEQVQNRKNLFSFYTCRMKVKAGLIGYTQVYGKYNASLEERLSLDLEYIQNYSILLDFQLFFLAIKFLFTPNSPEDILK